MILMNLYNVQIVKNTFVIVAMINFVENHVHSVNNTIEHLKLKNKDKLENNKKLKMRVKHYIKN